MSGNVSVWGFLNSMRITDVVNALPSFDSSDLRAGILLHQLVLYRELDTGSAMAQAPVLERRPWRTAPRLPSCAEGSWAGGFSIGVLGALPN